MVLRGGDVASLSPFPPKYEQKSKERRKESNMKTRQSEEGGGKKRWRGVNKGQEGEEGESKQGQAVQSCC